MFQNKDAVTQGRKLSFTFDEIWFLQVTQIVSSRSAEVCFNLMNDMWLVQQADELARSSLNFYLLLK